MVFSPDFSCSVIAVSLTFENFPVVFLDVNSTTWIFCPGCRVLKFIQEDLSAWAEDRDGIANKHAAMISDRIMPPIPCPTREVHVQNRYVRHSQTFFSRDAPEIGGFPKPQQVPQELRPSSLGSGLKMRDFRSRVGQCFTARLA